MRYFPDYTDSEVPERDFFFGVLAGIRGEELKSLIDEAMARRQSSGEQEEDKLIEINDEYFEALAKLPTYKSKSFDEPNLSYSNKRKSHSFDEVRSKT